MDGDIVVLIITRKSTRIIKRTVCILTCNNNKCGFSPCALEVLCEICADPSDLLSWKRFFSWPPRDITYMNFSLNVFDIDLTSQSRIYLETRGGGVRSRSLAWGQSPRNTCSRPDRARLILAPPNAVIPANRANPVCRVCWLTRLPSKLGLLLHSITLMDSRAPRLKLAFNKLSSAINFWLFARRLHKMFTTICSGWARIPFFNYSFFCKWVFTHIFLEDERKRLIKSPSRSEETHI